jgi:hypothetical protein
MYVRRPTGRVPIARDKKSRVICNDRGHRESCDRWDENVEGNEVKALTARSSKRVVGYIQELNIAKDAHKGCARP